MSIAERARELAEKMSHSLCADREERQQRNAAVIEQALLAERRLAKLEDAEFVAEYHSKESAYYNNSPSVYMQAQCRDIAKALRAAAENEVSAPNAECPLHGSLSVQRRVKMQAEGKPIPCTRVTTPRGGE